MRRTWFLLSLLVGCHYPEIRRDISYDDRFGIDTTMDVYLPTDNAAERPAVMFVHGGAWAGGSKLDYALIATRLARAGYVTASINYRLAPESIFPAQVQDAWCALSFLRQNATEFGLDPARIAVIGYSAGGHLVSMLGTSDQVPEVQPDCAAGPTAAPAAVVSGAGGYDMRPEAIPPNRDISLLEQFMGGSPEEIPDQYTLASPIVHLDASVPPFLLIHGTFDAFIPFAQAPEMRDAIEAVGGDIELVALTGAGHLGNPSVNPGGFQIVISSSLPEGWEATMAFLERTIGVP